MGRFMYVHFGDDVPRNIEKEYNKLLRKERYLEELDAKNGKIYPEDKVTMWYLVEKYGLSIDMVRYRIKIAKQKLKEYIILHENE